MQQDTYFILSLFNTLTYDVVIVMSFRIMETISVLVCPAKHRLSLASRRPVAARQCHARPTQSLKAALVVPDESSGTNAKLSERGAEGTLSGTGCLISRIRDRGDPRTAGAPNLAFGSRGCFSCSLVGISRCMKGVFFRG